MPFREPEVSFFNPGTPFLERGPFLTFGEEDFE